MAAIREHELVCTETEECKRYHVTLSKDKRSILPPRSISIECGCTPGPRGDSCCLQHNTSLPRITAPIPMETLRRITDHFGGTTHSFRRTSGTLEGWKSKIPHYKWPHARECTSDEEAY